VTPSGKFADSGTESATYRAATVRERYETVVNYRVLLRGRYSIALKLAVGLLLSVCLCSAQFGWFSNGRRTPKKTAKTQDSGESTLGVVVKKTSDSFVIRTVDTRFVGFKIADTTLFFHGSSWTSPTKLGRGAVVQVAATADADGQLTATDVVFQDFRPVLNTRAQASGLLPGGVTDDPLVQRAREASNSFFSLLPNFICQQSTTRSYAGAEKRWRILDQVTAEVLYEHGHESYREVKLNGKPTGRSMMDLPGSRSTGEFGSTLRALFDKDTSALFKFHGNASLSGFSTAIYDFAVSGDQSDWRISAGSQMIMTAYAGKIWIDRKSGNVVRIEMKAVDIPQAFPFQRVDSEVDYGPVQLPSGRYFLPERAENVSCNNPKSCNRNVIEFRNYHKYVGKSSISFDAPEPEKPDGDTGKSESTVPLLPDPK